MVQDEGPALLRLVSVQSMGPETRSMRHARQVQAGSLLKEMVRAWDQAMLHAAAVGSILNAAEFCFL